MSPASSGLHRHVRSPSDPAGSRAAAGHGPGAGPRLRPAARRRAVGPRICSPWWCRSLAPWSIPSSSSSRTCTGPTIQEVRSSSAVFDEV